MKEEQHQRIEELLEGLRGAAGLVALEERVLEAGHLEEDDYGRLLSRSLSGQAYENLRHHLLFCPVCSQEFLRRVAPEVEQRFHQEERRASFKRLFWWSLALLLLAAGGAVLWHERERLFPARKKMPPSAERPLFALLWAGQGGLSGEPGLAGSKRLYLHLQGLAGEHGRHIYVFHVAGQRVTSLHPGAGVVGGQPERDAWIPKGGWRDPGGPDPAFLLVLATRRPLPELFTPGDRQAMASSLEEFLKGGGHILGLPGQLKAEFLGLRGRVKLLPLQH